MLIIDGKEVSNKIKMELKTTEKNNLTQFRYYPCR